MHGLALYAALALGDWMPPETPPPMHNATAFSEWHSKLLSDCKCSVRCVIQRTQSPWNKRVLVVAPYLPSHGFGAQFTRGIAPGLRDAVAMGARLLYGPLPVGVAGSKHFPKFNWSMGCPGHISPRDVFKAGGPLIFEDQEDLRMLGVDVTDPTRYIAAGEAAAEQANVKRDLKLLGSIFKNHAGQVTCSIPRGPLAQPGLLRAMSEPTIPIFTYVHNIVMREAARFLYNFQPVFQDHVDRAVVHFERAASLVAAPAPHQTVYLMVHLRGTDHSKVMMERCGCTTKPCNYSSCPPMEDILKGAASECVSAVYKNDTSRAKVVMFLAGDNATYLCELQRKSLRSKYGLVSMWSIHSCDHGSQSGFVYRGIASSQTCDHITKFLAEVAIFSSPTAHCYLGPGVSTHANLIKWISASKRLHMFTEHMIAQKVKAKLYR